MILSTGRHDKLMAVAAVQLSGAGWQAVLAVHAPPPNMTCCICRLHHPVPSPREYDAWRCRPTIARFNFFATRCTLFLHQLPRARTVSRGNLPPPVHSIKLNLNDYDLPSTINWPPPGNALPPSTPECIASRFAAPAQAARRAG